MIAPVLLGQAFSVRRKVQVLPEAEGPRQGRAGTGPQLRLLVIGDSSAAGVGADHQDQALLGQLVRRLSPHFTVDYTLLAQTGARTQDAPAWLAQVEGPIDLVVTAVGVNDVTKATPLGRFLGGQADLWHRLRHDHGAQQILVSGIPPVGLFPALPQPLRWVVGERARDFSAALVQLAEQTSGVEHVGFDAEFVAEEMASDGFHPGPAVYDKWAAALVGRMRLAHGSA